eukprot:scaffold22845_cov39-Attheya_sp.AAC.1
MAISCHFFGCGMFHACMSISRMSSRTHGSASGIPEYTEVGSGWSGVTVGVVWTEEASSSSWK